MMPLNPRTLPRRPLFRRLITTLIVALLCHAGHGFAQIMVVTGQFSHITSLPTTEAEQLYLGRLNALRDGTPVRLHDLPPGPTRDAFYQALTGKNPIQTRAYWSRIVFTGRARPPREVASLEHLRAALQADPNAIGYLPAAAVSEGLKILLTLDVAANMD